MKAAVPTVESNGWNWAPLLFVKSCVTRILISQVTWRSGSVLLSGLKFCRGLNNSFTFHGLKKPVWRSSSLPWLHVGRYSSSGSQAFKSFVGVVDEDPVLVLQVGFSLVGHLSSWRRRTGRWRKMLFKHFKAEPQNMKCVDQKQVEYLLVWGYLNQGTHQSWRCRRCFWSL